MTSMWVLEVKKKPKVIIGMLEAIDCNLRALCKTLELPSDKLTEEIYQIIAKIKNEQPI